MFFDALGGQCLSFSGLHRRIQYFNFFVNFSSYVVGTEATISELADFICAAQIAKAEDAFFTEDEVVFFAVITKLNIWCFKLLI